MTNEFSRPKPDLHRVLGLEGMRAVMAAFGGRRLHVPVTLGRATIIIRKVGEPTAALMVKHFGGCRLPIPRGPSDHNAVGKAIPVQMIVELTVQRMSAANIAEMLGCTERLVHKKRAQARKLYSQATVQPEPGPRKRAKR